MKHKSTDIQTIKIYWQQMRKHKVSFFIMLIAIPFSALMMDTALPYFLTQAIGSFTSNGTDQLYSLLTLAAVASVIGIVANMLGYQSAIYHESKVRALLAKFSLDELIHKDQNFFQNQKIGALTGKLIDFINAHVGLQDLFIIRTLSFSLSMTVGIAIIFYHSWLLGLIVIALILGVLFQARLSLKLRSHLRQERKKTVGMVNGTLADIITNNLTVKTFANEKFEIKETSKITDHYQRVYHKDFRWMSIERSIRLLALTIIQISAITIMAHMLSSGNLDLGIAIFVVAYLQQIATQIMNLGELVNGYDKLLLQAAPLTEILIEKPDIKNLPDAKALTVSSGSIQLINVDYAYSDDKETDVISNLSLSILPGQRVGIVGSSGAGKTTLTKILLRFDDIKNGQVLIDGQEIRSVTQESLRNNIAYVPQEPLLFHRSIRENIAYGKLDASDEEIRKASQAAHALEFIEKLPAGFETIVGERGVKLSGGQKQRVAIARAILKDAPILILDEATSALDSESEKLIQASLDSLMHDRTSIVIAHRLSTIAKLDRIIVMENGSIIEDGSHQELLSLDGKYASLWKHQSGGFFET